MARDIWHMTEIRRIHSLELLPLALLLVLFATGILNDLPRLTSCHCSNIGLVSLILLDWELRVLYVKIQFVRSPCTPQTESDHQDFLKYTIMQAKPGPSLYSYTVLP